MRDDIERFRVLAPEALAFTRVDESRYLGNIDRATDRASGLCDQLLAYAGGGQFTISTFDLSGLVADMADLPQAGLTPRDVLSQLTDAGVDAQIVDTDIVDADVVDPPDPNRESEV